jgi:TonB-linked SusC/RagA family outer membrane protein
MKKLCGFMLPALVMIVFLAVSAFAQVGGVKGTITDDQTGSTLPGANVFLERTSYGAATDADGIYTISNVLQGQYTLVVSFVGYVQHRQAIIITAGDIITVDIKLKPSTVQLNPVVVTAIGTQANREQLGTSVSSIEGSQLATTGAHDIISSIAALAPGVNTTEATGDPGSATRIILRGPKSFQNDNQPLIVIDGIPVDNTALQPINNQGDVAGTAMMSTISDISPDNIQSMQIYSGPAAASLWGSKAANGVIAITTKSGGQVGTKKLSLSIRSRTFSDEVLHTTPLQTSFGQGTNGNYSQATSFSWGDPIFLRSDAADVLARPSYPYSLIAAGGKNSRTTYNHASELFHAPVSEDYGVTLRGGDEYGDFYLDLGQLQQQGIILSNSNYKRTSIRSNATRKFTDNVIARINVGYTNSSSDRIQQGSNTSGLLLGAYRTPPDFNSNPYLVNYIDPAGNITYGVQRTYRNAEGNPGRSWGYDNPLFTIYNVPSIISTNRLIGNAEISYDPYGWLDFTYRLGVDYGTDKTESNYPIYDAQFPSGYLTRSTDNTLLLNSDLMGRATQHLTDDIEGTLMLGFHLDQNRYDGLSATATSFILTGAPATFSNSLYYTPSEYLTIIRTAALYGSLDLGLYKQLFLKFTGRNESASTYGPAAAQSYFYPSFSAAWQFTQLQPIKDALAGSTILSFGKIRAAYGQAANQPPAYVTKSYYNINPSFGNGWGEALAGQYYGGNAAKSDVLGNSLLEPEKTAETELGADLRFANDRISLSYTYYSNKTTGAILGVAIAPSSGYTNKWANAASMTNKGSEVQIIGDWLHLGEFSWSSTINWSHNKNVVTDLSGVNSVFLNGFSDPSSRAILNQPYGVLYGTRWDRKADGSLNLDASGFPQTATEDGIIGDPNPNYRMGIINTFRFERFTLSVLVDIKQGGDVWNGTKGALSYFGTAGYQNWWTTISATDAANLLNYNGQTVVAMSAAGRKAYVHNSDGTYSFRGYVKDFGGGRVIIDQSYFTSGPGSGFTGPAEQFVEKASYVRLRDVTLSYTFPLQFVGMQSATISVTGRNLKLWTDYTGNDPESNLTGPSNGQGLDYFNNPTTRSYILSIQLEY